MRFKFFVAIAAAVLSSACSTFTLEDAQFVGYNVSNDNIVIVVNGGVEHPISANGSASFIVQVSVPKNPVPVGYFGTVTGPSSVDKRVQVSVAAKNLRTGRLTSPVVCDAGAKVVTSITYRVDFGYENTSCFSSY